MTLKIDGAGRVVLPKKIRDRFGLRAGSDLEMVEGAEGVTLKPVRPKASLVKKGRFLVHTGCPPVGYDFVKAVEEDRELRDREVWGR